MTREEAIETLANLPRASFAKYSAPPFYEAIDMAVSALKEQPRWISVDERLPEVGEEVLVCDSECGFQSVWTLADDLWWLSERDEYFVIHEATHWMPLPEAPKEEICA